MPESPEIAKLTRTMNNLRCIIIFLLVMVAALANQAGIKAAFWLSLGIALLLFIELAREYPAEVLKIGISTALLVGSGYMLQALFI